MLVYLFSYYLSFADVIIIEKSILFWVKRAKIEQINYSN